ncbi:hypothetical protein ACWFQ8_24430 [Streptomyces sp. NPDC055254]
MREHLDAEDGPGPWTDEALCDPGTAFEAFRDRAAALDAWHDGGGRGPRPPDRLRRYVPPELPAFQRVLAGALHHVLVDPGGRPMGMRLRNRF